MALANLFVDCTYESQPSSHAFHCDPEAVYQFLEWLPSHQTIVLNSLVPTSPSYHAWYDVQNWMGRQQQQEQFGKGTKLWGSSSGGGCSMEIRLVQGKEEEEAEKGEEEEEEKKKAGNRAWVMAVGAVAIIITNSWDCQKMGPQQFHWSHESPSLDSQLIAFSSLPHSPQQI